MESVALQQFLALRQSAVERLQQPASTSSTSSTSKTATQNWQAILEAKRNEMGIGAQGVTRNTASTVQSKSYSQTFPQDDYQARAENLRSQLAQGLPIRRIGSLLDVRA